MGNEPNVSNLDFFCKSEESAVTSFQENKTLCEQMIDSQLECVTELKYIENRVLW